MATPIQLGWEAQMDNHAKLAVKCIQSRDFSPFQIIRAHDIISGIDHTVTLYAAFESKELAKEAEAHIKGENIDLTNKGNGNYKYFSDKVEGLKDKDIKGQDPKVVKEDWEKMMDKEADDASERSSKFIHENKDKCVKYIYTLPDEAREPAANLWKNTLNVVMDFFKDVWNTITDVCKQVVEFLKGLWNKIVQAWNKVVDWCKGAIDTIGGWFGGYSAEAIWPQEYGLGKVHAEVGALADELSREGVSVERANVERIGGKWTVTTNLSGYSGANSAGLESLWKRAVSLKTAAT